MKINIDQSRNSLTFTPDDEQAPVEYPLFSDAAFEVISNLWVKLGWNQKYPYTFSWMGRPVIQLPEDLIRIQEVIYLVKPDVIIETGVAHGGSLIFYASLCKAMGRGRIIGIDIEIRQTNRKAIESHELADFVTLLEGSSTAAEVLNKIREQIAPSDTVLVILDSCHERDHVYHELELYSRFVTPGSYIVATDGIMKYLHDVPRGNKNWKWDNPEDASKAFAEAHPEFALETPTWPFNESNLSNSITHWPNAWLRRIL